jgi:hypothetical protein
MQTLCKLLSSNRRHQQVNHEDYKTSTDFCVNDLKFNFLSRFCFTASSKEQNTQQYLLFLEILDYQLIEISNNDNNFIITYQNPQDSNQKIILKSTSCNKDQEVKRSNYLETLNSKQDKNQNNAINKLLIKGIGQIMVLSYKYCLPYNSTFSVISDFSYQGRIFDLEISNQKIQPEFTSKNFANQSIKIIKAFIELNQTDHLVNPDPFKQNIN